MMRPKLWLALITLVVAVGLVAALRERRIAAVEADFGDGAHPAG